MSSEGERESRRRSKLKSSSSEGDYEKVLAERNALLDVVARKNEAIEKLRTAMVSARDLLSQAVEESGRSAAASASAADGGNNKTNSPETPKHALKRTRKDGSGLILKRTASCFEHDDHDGSERSLKRSSRSAPERRTFLDS